MDQESQPTIGKNLKVTSKQLYVTYIYIIYISPQRFFKKAEKTTKLFRCVKTFKYAKEFMNYQPSDVYFG